MSYPRIFLIFTLNRYFDLHVVNGSHVFARRSDHLARVNHFLGYQIKWMKKILSHKSGLIEGLRKEQTTLKKELETSSQLSEERVKRVDDLNRELAVEKEAAKAWADERAALIAERDDSRARYGELERARADDIIQFASQRRREFLASPNYASKVSSECVAYFHSFSLDHKDRFLDLVTLFGEEKASKPDWYRNLSLDEEGDSTDEEEDASAELPTVVAKNSELSPNEANPPVNP
ncbi:hypothetical protein LIER_40811 [Lithospermum erythrorhizon]|uniref:Uncharacterized protein n=1 Tax=Lithospermum erythrorhizon TaxID=34254 RepID=A0AAV3R1G9_LITER